MCIVQSSGCAARDVNPIRAMSTRCSLGQQFIGEGVVLYPFSGKLSHVTPMFDKQKQIEPEELPTEVAQIAPTGAPRELGGREGPEPTRFGDWELRGRCIDF